MVKFRIKLTMLSWKRRKRGGLGVFGRAQAAEIAAVSKTCQRFFFPSCPLSLSQPGQFSSVFAFSRCRLLHTFIVLINHIRSARNMEHIFHSQVVHTQAYVFDIRKCVWFVCAVIRYRRKFNRRRRKKVSRKSSVFYLLSWHGDFSLKLITNFESVCLILLAVCHLNALMNFHLLD